MLHSDSSADSFELFDSSKKTLFKHEDLDDIYEMFQQKSIKSN